MHSDCSPLPVLLLSNVVGDIHEGCYLLYLLQGPSHLRQYLKDKKKEKNNSLYICSTKTPTFPSNTALSNYLHHDHQSFLARVAPQVNS